VLEIGGYRNGDFPEDYELWLRMHEQRLAMEKIAATLLQWRDSRNRLSRTDVRYDRSAFDRLRADYLGRDPRVRQPDRPLAVWGAGRRTRGRVNHLLAKGFSPALWIDIDPRKIGNRLKGVPVVSPDTLRTPDHRRHRPFVLGYVANHGARDYMRQFLTGIGYREGDDFLFVG
jgi:hypothetical protein